MKRFHRTMLAAGSSALLLAVVGCASPNDSSRRTETAPPKSPNSYEANNTGRNAETQSQPTPLDQGTSDTDMTTTQQIRQALVDENTLSMTAKNCKVITRDGKVTLRGPVIDANERTRIEGIAERIAGNGNVTNQLELETPKS